MNSVRGEASVVWRFHHLRGDPPPPPGWDWVPVSIHLPLSDPRLRLPRDGVSFAIQMALRREFGEGEL